MRPSERSTAPKTVPLSRRERIEHGGTVDAVVEQIRSGLTIGRYVPGQRLIEADLAQEMGVSRGPLREALRLLSLEGIIELIPNRGAVVRRLTRKEMKELFVVRAINEGLAARLAAQNIGISDHRASLLAVIAPLKGKERVNVDLFEHNQVFHQTIARIAGNSQLEQLILRMRFPLITIQLRDFLTREHANGSMDDHLAIAAAILAGDAKGAEKAMQKHVNNAAERCRGVADFLFKPD